MRALLAAGLALFLVLVAAAPHVHTGPHGGNDCAVCVVGHSDVARTATPDVAPAVRIAGEAQRAPGLPPVSGAPLGAIPGQSPPATA